MFGGGFLSGVLSRTTSVVGGQQKMQNFGTYLQVLYSIESRNQVLVWLWLISLNAMLPLSLLLWCCGRNCCKNGGSTLGLSLMAMLLIGQMLVPVAVPLFSCLGCSLECCDVQRLFVWVAACIVAVASVADVLIFRVEAEAEIPIR